MSKRITLVVALLGAACFVEASQAPKKAKRRWTTGTLRTLRRKKDPKQVLLEQMNQAWEQVISIFNQQVQHLSRALDDIGPDKVKDELDKPDKKSYITSARSLFQAGVADYLSTYLPSKLQEERSLLQGDEVIRQAEINKAKAERMVAHFEQQFVDAVRQLKDPQPPQSPQRARPAHQPSVSLETRVTQEWTNILQEMDKSASTIAETLDVNIPVANQDDNSLLAQLASNPGLVNEEFDKIAAMIDRFEIKWNKLFPTFKDEDKKEAVDIFNGFIKTKPQSIDDFKAKIIEYWRNPSAA